MRSAEARWAIVLAGGEGERLKSWTREKFGEAKPKQYCSVGGERTLLELALERAAAVAPPERILTVIEALRRAVDTRYEPAVLEWVYQGLARSNFSRDVLEKAAARALVLPLRGVDWSDWGRPERIEHTLSRLSQNGVAEMPIAAPETGGRHDLRNP